MFILRQGLFEVKGELKTFEPLPEGVRLNFDDGQFVEINLKPLLLQALKSVGIVKLKDSTVDVVMGKVFLNQSKRNKLEQQRKKVIAKEETKTTEENEKSIEESTEKN